MDALALYESDSESSAEGDPSTHLAQATLASDTITAHDDKRSVATRLLENKPDACAQDLSTERQEASQANVHACLEGQLRSMRAPLPPLEYQMMLRVFIPLPDLVEDKNLLEFSSRFEGLVRLGFVNAASKPCLQLARGLHVSLSRPCAVVDAEIEQIVTSVRAIAEASWAFEYTVRGEVIPLMNETETRVFLAAPVRHRGSDDILRLIGRLDSSMTRHGKRPFFENPRPHVSFVSFRADEAGNSPLATSEQEWRQVTSGPVTEYTCTASRIQCMVGTRRGFTFALRSRIND